MSCVERRAALYEASVAPSLAKLSFADLRRRLGGAPRCCDVVRNGRARSRTDGLRKIARLALKLGMAGAGFQQELFR